MHRLISQKGSDSWGYHVAKCKVRLEVRVRTISPIIGSWLVEGIFLLFILHIGDRV